MAESFFASLETELTDRNPMAHPRRLGLKQLSPLNLVTRAITD